MIKAVTSIADLLFKAKTQEPYKQLVILTVNEVFAKTDPTPIDTYEKAVVALDKYTQGVTDCSVIVSSIIWMRNRIPDPADVEFNKLFVLKERQPRRVDTAADNARPQFNGEYLTVSGGGGYSRVSEEYERMRREANRNGDMFVLGTQQQRRERLEQNNGSTVSMAGTDYEIIQRHYINPVTGVRQVISRQIPLGIPLSIRREIEDELENEANTEIQRQITSANRRRTVSRLGDPDDFYSSYWDDDLPTRRRINEDSPNADR